MNRETKLKTIRKENKIKMREMAERLGVSISYYWQIETGRKRLFYDRALQIASIFNMKPDDLFYADWKRKKDI